MRRHLGISGLQAGEDVKTRSTFGILARDVKIGGQDLTEACRYWAAA
jgi:hypothetical protein